MDLLLLATMAQTALVPSPSQVCCVTLSCCYVSEPHTLNKSLLIAHCGLDLSQLLMNAPAFLMSVRI